MKKLESIQTKTITYRPPTGTFVQNAPFEPCSFKNSSTASNILQSQNVNPDLLISFTSNQANTRATSKITIAPIGVENLSHEDSIIGKTTVINESGKEIEVDVYKCFDKRYEGQEFYKFVEGKNQVIGYSIQNFDKEKNVIDELCIGTLKPQYKGIGQKLSQVQYERMCIENADKVNLISSWNSFDFHYKNGFRPKDQKAIIGSDVDKVIENAIKNNDSTEHLHCITMFLPQKTLEKVKKSTEKILTFKDRKNGTVGSVEIGGKRFNVEKQTNASGFETFFIKNDDEKIGNIVLNYYKNKVVNGKQEYSSSYGTYSADSPFAVYGNEEKSNLFKNKVFAEFWSVDDKGKYDGEEILKKLFQIAIESGDKKGCPRLQIEADWDEHPLAYEYGFKTQDKKAVPAAEIEKLYLAEKKLSETKGRHINTQQLGSVEMTLDLGLVKKVEPILFDYAKKIKFHL